MLSSTSKKEWKISQIPKTNSPSSYYVHINAEIKQRQLQPRIKKDSNFKDLATQHAIFADKYFYLERLLQRNRQNVPNNYTQKIFSIAQL